MTELADWDALSVVVGLLLVAVVLVSLAPIILSRGRWRIRLPRTALTLWYLAFLGGLACAAVSLVIAVVAATAQYVGEMDEWLASALVLVGWCALVSAGAVTALVLSRVEPIAAADRALHTTLSVLAATSRCYQLRGVPVVVVESEVPVAFSVSGSDARILVTTRLESDLTPDQLRAVIEHERAHVVRHHGLLLQLAQLNRSCAPVLPGARELERDTVLLVELIADDAAARSTCALDTANALLAVGTLQSDDAILLRARRIAERPPHGTTSRRHHPVDHSPVFG